MTWLHRTMFVRPEIVHLAQGLALTLEPDAAENMWTTPCYDPAGDVAWFVSSGLIWPEFAEMLSSPEALFAACEAREITGVTLEDCQFILANADVSDEDPHAAMARLGVTLQPADGGSLD
jgi:hypothetical protein